MKKKPKQAIYWLGYFVILLAGMYLSRYQIISVQNTSIFLFGLMWIWTGSTVIFHVNPYYAQNYTRKYQLIIALSCLGLGVSWVIISLNKLSNQGIPILLISAPFLLIDLWVFLHKGSQPT